VRGPVGAHWWRHDDGLELRVRVPVGATAEVHVPAAARGDVRIPAGLDSPVVREPGWVVCTAGAGEWTFRAVQA
ncbi:MAG TPA: alpha-L-rhamnosidase C-terminal domain-containing protein, partial [Pseudonocardia sp.]|nr:alpha-L-rhamnosidase C-terminal domain-containing protein [Pseudonocardia sp.]